MKKYSVLSNTLNTSHENSLSIILSSPSRAVEHFVHGAQLVGGKARKLWEPPGKSLQGPEWFNLMDFWNWSTSSHLYEDRALYWGERTGYAVTKFSRTGIMEKEESFFRKQGRKTKPRNLQKQAAIKAIWIKIWETIFT